MVVNSSNGTGLIQALGIGSGLDIQSLVSQLVTAESAPVQNRLSRQASDVATQVSAMGTLRGALAAFQSALTPLKDTAVFDVLSAQSADIEVFTATADSDAVAGAYEIEVQQLAKAEQLVSNAFAGGASSVVGDGTLTVTLGTTAFSVGIGATANTLAQIRDAINTASDNPGVRATLVYGQTGARLVLSSTATGASNSIRVSAAGGDGGLAQLTYAGGVSPNYTQNQAAQDAIVRISGVEKHSASNVISDAIDGVAITLKSEDPGNTATLTIASDQDAVAANVRKFVTAYNAMRTRLDSLSFYDAASKTAGPLLGDPLMSGVERQLRRLTTSAVGGLTGNYTSLAAIGITSDAKGKLVLNEDKLDLALSADRGAVAKLFGATGGVALRLDTALTQQLAGSGTMAARDKSLVDAQKAINTEGQRHQTRMLAVQQRYLAQFSALDSLMQQMNQTSTFLTQQLAQLDKATSG